MQDLDYAKLSAEIEKILRKATGIVLATCADVLLPEDGRARRERLQ
ncbi:MAG: hypothetical protein LBG83_02505 [Oscillospiraceae bacterium]|jgi:hypothetical protein|nr:hypothetical protein [Oscillospiraceae bacterium]